MESIDFLEGDQSPSNSNSIQFDPRWREIASEVEAKFPLISYVDIEFWASLDLETLLEVKSIQWTATSNSLQQLLGFDLWKGTPGVDPDFDANEERRRLFEAAKENFNVVQAMGAVYEAKQRLNAMAQAIDPVFNYGGNFS